MQSFTLDTNCMISVERNQADKEAVLELVNVAKKGGADVALVASTASERQIDGSLLDSFADLVKRLQKLGFGHLEIILPIGHTNFGYINHCLIADEARLQREEEIFEGLFPKSSYSWSKFAENALIDAEDHTTVSYYKWRNKMIDTQMYWAHEHHKRNIFVSSDKNFKKLLALDNFSNAVICNPTEACDLLNKRFSK